MTEEKSETGGWGDVSRRITWLALGVIRVCDDNLRMNKQAHGDDYPEGDEIAYDVCTNLVEIFFRSDQADAMEAVEGWADHERWC